MKFISFRKFYCNTSKYNSKWQIILVLWQIHNRTHSPCFKFIKRKIGKSTYYLDTELVFKNCDLLINDEDEFVQKSIGWLLKVTSVQHEYRVIDYIQNNFGEMPQSTIRYAIEKMDANTRKRLRTLNKKS